MNWDAVAGSGSITDLGSSMRRQMDEFLARGCDECGAKPAHGTAGCLNCNKTIRLCQSCHDKMDWRSLGDFGRPEKLECHHS